MPDKLRIGLIFGGKSAEHEVSLQSARSIAGSLDKEKYDITYIGLDKKGNWYIQDDINFLLHDEDITQVELKEKSDRTGFLPGDDSRELISIRNPGEHRPIDVVFPILHGPFGEDGTIQGFLKLADVPFVGPGVLGSAVGMDKDVMKRLLRDAGIPIGKYIVRHRHEKISFREIEAELGLPLFIKPANLGSSVGISRVADEKDFAASVAEAFLFDRKIIFEENIVGREIECAVLGNESPAASRCGEVIPEREFYSYKAKYVDSAGARLNIPADLDPETEKRVQDIAVKTFKVLCCEGLSRVDVFLKKNGDIIVNEINTLPGFTRISMYPKLWEVSGLSYEDLLDRLIELAIDRYKKEKALKTTV